MTRRRINASYIRYTLGLNGITNQTQYFYTFKFEGQKNNIDHKRTICEIKQK